MHGELAMAVVLASQGTAALRGEAAPGLDDPDGIVRRMAPADFDPHAWLHSLGVERIWLERDWSLLAGDLRWYLVSGTPQSHPTPAGTRPWRPSIDDAGSTLRAAIAASAANARRDGHDSWAAYFDQALTSDAPDDLLLAPGAPQDARLLSGLVGSAWCFGGMGSWNDVANDDAGLYDALVVALGAAVNT